MKAHHILIYLGMLALLLVVALMSGRIQRESQRLEFTTWVPIAIVVAVIAARYFFSGRSKRVAAEPDETRRETVAAEEPTNIPARPLSIRPVLLVVAIAVAFLIGSWLCLIYLGSLGGQDSQSTAQMCLLIVTSAVTTIAAVPLSKLEIARQSRKDWVSSSLRCCRSCSRSSGCSSCRWLRSSSGTTTSTFEHIHLSLVFS